MAKEPTKKATKKAASKAVTKKVAAKKAATKTATVKKTPVKKVAAKKTARTTTKKAPAKAGAASASKPAVAPVTTVIAKADVGFGNSLYIRGEGAGLSWDKGVLMDNSASDEWVWKSKEVTTDTPFKLVLNDDDNQWSIGPNCLVIPGSTVVVEPVFES